MALAFEGFGQLRRSRIFLSRAVRQRFIRSIVRPFDERKLDSIAGRPPLHASQEGAHSRITKNLPLRTGIIAKKCGMTAYFDAETGKRTPVTILQTSELQVIYNKTQEKHGYWAVQLGMGKKHPRNVTKPELGHFAVANVTPKRKIMEFRVKDELGLLPIGTTIKADWLKVGGYVDIQGTCKGKGFAGGMKLHGWSGQPASHGQSLTHRTMGSAGGSQGSGSRVIPGKKMPGRMGNHKVTVKNSRIVFTDKKHDYIVVAGCVPGPIGSFLKLKDALQKPWPTESHEPAESEIRKTDITTSQHK